MIWNDFFLFVGRTLRNFKVFFLSKHACFVFSLTSSEEDTSICLLFENRNDTTFTRRNDLVILSLQPGLNCSFPCCITNLSSMYYSKERSNSNQVVDLE